MTIWDADNHDHAGFRDAVPPHAGAVQRPVPAVLPAGGAAGRRRRAPMDAHSRRRRRP